MLFINQLENTCFLSDEVRKKMRLAYYWDVTFLTQIVPSYYFTVT